MNDDIKDYYNRRAEKWMGKPNINPFFHEVPFRKFESLFKEGDKILDIGCAGGVHVPLFFGIGRKLSYEGIDISEEMIKIAQSRFPQLDFKVGDILDFKSGKKYAGFWSAATLMHIPEENHDKLFSHLEELIMPGGFGYITMPAERPNPETETDQRHFSLFSQEVFESIIRSHNWQVVESGSLFGVAENLVSNWYIVQLPG